MKKYLIVGLLSLAAPALRAEVWDATTPTGNEAKSLGDDRIREMKVALEAALEWSGVFPGSNPATSPMYQWTLDYGLSSARPTDSLQDGQLYNSTDTAVIERYSTVGTTWTVISVGFPAGTKTIFYQPTCPTGWTLVGSIGDKFLRVSTSTTNGGSTGGTMAASTSLAHTHTLAHTHDLSNHTHTTPAHTHDLEHVAGIANSGGSLTEVYSDNASGGQMLSAATITADDVWNLKNRTETSGSGTSGVPSTNTSGAASSETTSSGITGAFAYADVIICTKN